MRKAHAKALRLSKVAPFVLYSLRHTFATRIAPHVDAWTLCKVMGWASLSVAMRYIHPTSERVLAAFGQSETGDKSGDNALQLPSDRLAEESISPAVSSAS